MIGYYRIALVGFVFAPLVLVTEPGMAQFFSKTYNVETRKGKRVKLGQRYYWDINCKPQFYSAHIVEKPKHGSVSVTTATGKINKKTSHCRGKTKKGMRWFYTPASGFSGKDKVKIKAKSKYSTDYFTYINVVK